MFGSEERAAVKPASKDADNEEDTTEKWYVQFHDYGPNLWHAHNQPTLSPQKLYFCLKINIV